MWGRTSFGPSPWVRNAGNRAHDSQIAERMMRFLWSVFRQQNVKIRIQPGDTTDSNPAFSDENVLHRAGAQNLPKSARRNDLQRANGGKAQQRGIAGDEQVGMAGERLT